MADYLAGRVAAGRGIRTFPLTGELLSLYLSPFYFVVMVPFLFVRVVALLRRRDVQSWAHVFWFATVVAF